VSDFATLFADRRPKLGVIAIDCSIDETHEHSARVTDYPVEAGSERSDHIQLMPERVTMTGRVSATPAQLGTQLQPDFDPLRHITAWQQLVELFDLREPFTLVTSLHVYADMVFESLVATRSFETTHVLEFQASLRQLETAFTTFAETKVADELKDVFESAANSAMQGATIADESSKEAAVAALGAG
jgi:hypothetical protein